MTAELILALIIIVTILVIVFSGAKRCACGCSCCSAGQACRCGCKQGHCNHAGVDMEMEITGPYEYPTPPPVGALIVAGVESQPIHVPSRTSHVGSWVSAPPRVLLFTEPIYSQHGEGSTCEAPHEDCYHGSPVATKNVQVEKFIDKINNTRRVYLHYTNWCGFCKKMKPIWAQVKETLAETAVEFYEIDEDVAKTPGVNSYPTILMIDENGFRHQYPGAYNFEQLRSWCVSPDPPQKTH